MKKENRGYRRKKKAKKKGEDNNTENLISILLDNMQIYDLLISDATPQLNKLEEY